MMAAPVVVALSALPGKAFVVVQDFATVCPQGSGFTSASGSFLDFLNYLVSSSDQACHIGNVKFNDFSPIPFGLLLEVGAVLSFAQESNSDGTITDILVQSPTILLNETEFNYTVSGSAAPGSDAFFTSWRSRAGGSAETDGSVTTTSDPLFQSCETGVQTGPMFGDAPVCTAPPGTLVSSLAITNRVSGMLTAGELPAFFSTSFLSNGQPSEPGTTPENPLLPPAPQVINQPWIFPPVVVIPQEIWWFDPEVAIGYIFNVADATGPLFDQFIAPDLPFNNEYELLTTGGAACSTNPNDFTAPLATITQLVPYDFPTPLACFAIKGISEQNALDPLNTTAFVSGISFDAAGTVTVSQTPIPTPGPLPIAGAGLAYGWARRLRQRLRASR
jgi:hypothetical protein